MQNKASLCIEQHEQPLTQVDYDALLSAHMTHVAGYQGDHGDENDSALLKMYERGEIGTVQTIAIDEQTDVPAHDVQPIGHYVRYWEGTRIPCGSPSAYEYNLRRFVRDGGMVDMNAPVPNPLPSTPHTITTMLTPTESSD